MPVSGLNLGTERNRIHFIFKLFLKALPLVHIMAFILGEGTLSLLSMLWGPTQTDLSVNLPSSFDLASPRSLATCYLWGPFAFSLLVPVFRDPPSVQELKWVES